MTWEYDPGHSLIEFAGSHLGLATVKGRFNRAAVRLSIDEQDATRSSLDATIEAASLDTGNEVRDAQLRSETYLDVERYPTITFWSRRIEPRNGRYAVIGELTIHGVSREVELDAEFHGERRDQRGRLRRGFAASTTIARFDYGIEERRIVEGAFVVGEEVRISLEVEAIKQE